LLLAFFAGSFLTGGVLFRFTVVVCITITICPEEAEITVGFFQIGGEIASTFPICVVPMIHKDLRGLYPD
jgi:hypothetical protein